MDAASSPQATGLVGRTFGEFVVREPMSSGGFGMVFRAEQPALAREAVIKVLHTRLLDSETTVQRFLREARLASRLDHPYAAHTYAFGVEPDGVLWIAMELVRGTPLDRLLAAQGPIPLERFLPLLERICEVVHTAHEQGIVHRDLKPGNVMVLARAGRLLPKLLDFGIAKLAGDDGAGGATTVTTATATRTRTREPAALAETMSDAMPTGGGTLTDDRTVAIAQPVPGRPLRASLVSDGRLTEDGTVIGSPHYMAPEQWMDAGLTDARTDLYALAVLCHEVLTGHPPFAGRTRIELAQAHANQSPPPLGRDFPPALDAVLARAMAKDPAERYPNVLDFAAAFRAASGIESEPLPLPRLGDPLRAAVLSDAPQPLAEAIALCEASRHPHQARDAARQATSVAVRLVAATALACHQHVGPGAASDPTLGDALRALRRPSLSDQAWLALARELARPFASLRDAYPVPELVDFLFGPGSAALDQLVALHAARDRGGDSEERVVGLLEEMMPMLEATLGGLAFLSDYPLAVPGEGDAELWIGARSARRRIGLSSRRLPAGRPALIDQSGLPVVCLWPYVQVLEPSPGAEPRLFFFDGKGTRGARLVALPHAFEHEDAGLWEALGGLIRDDGAAPGPAEQCPFPGLAAFTREDAAHFTGRERETEAAVNRLRQQPLLAVVGPSGAGKSSFVQAGILPALPADWVAVVTRPGPTPLVSLAARLEAAGVAVGDLRAEVEEHAGALGALLRAHLAARQSTAVLVVDQLEELFTLCDDPGERELYAAALVRAARSPDDRVRVIVTLRDDFLVRAAALAGFGARLAPAMQILATPAEPELVRILCEPLARAGYELDDPALAGEMVREVAERPGALALLSFAASKLWELRDQRFRQLSRKAYLSIGGIGGALARHADATFAALHGEEQRLVRELFRHAVTAEGTRAVLSRDELEQILGAGGGSVVEKLVAARLLVASESERGRERIEIAHEALIEAWPRLAEWRRQDADGARLRDQLRVAARQWDERGRPGGLLWRGEALAEYRLWRARSEGRLTDSEEAFAAASLADEARVRRLRRALIATTIVGLLAVVVALLFLNREAERSKERSDSSRAELSRLVRKQYESQGRQLVLAGDPVHGLAYLAKARELGAAGPAHDFLVAEALRATDGELYEVRQSDALTRARFSPDGRYLVTCGFDDEARVWDARDGRPVARLRHQGPVRRVEFAGSRVLTASSDGTAAIWTLPGGERVRSFAHGGAVQAALFTPDGQTVATVGADDSVKLWRASGELRQQLLPGGPVVARLIGTPAAFSPDGTLLAVGGDDGVLRLWKVTGGAPLAVTAAHGGRINEIRFAPDGQRLATASSDGSAAIWRLDGGLVARLSHRAPVYFATFSPDGSRIVTASADRTAMVWDARRGGALLTLSGHAASVSQAVFSPDGRRIATASDDATAQIWDAESGRRLARRLGHQTSIAAIELDATGTRMATAALEAAIVWTTEPEERLRLLENSREAAVWAEFSPDDARVVTAATDGRVAIWDTRSTRRLAIIEAHQSSANVARFSPDGLVIATGGDDGMIRLWDAATGAPAAALKGHRAAVSHLAWAADGARLVSGSADGTVRTWSAAGKPLRVLEAGSPVFAVEFTRRGSRIVATTTDSQTIWDAGSGKQLVKHRPADAGYTLDLAGELALSCTLTAPRVWQVDTGKVLAELVGHAGDVASCRFNRDGTLAATGSTDGTARIWDPITGDLLAIVRGTSVEVRSVAFSHDGAQLLIGGDSGAALWPLPAFSGDFDRVMRCRVPFEVAGDRLLPRRRDPGACGAR